MSPLAESVSSSALCARLTRQLTDRNRLKNRVVAGGGVDSNSLEWQVENAPRSGTRSRRKPLFPVFNSSTFTSQHIYRRRVTVELALPCPIQMAPTLEQGAFYGGWRRRLAAAAATFSETRYKMVRTRSKYSHRCSVLPSSFFGDNQSSAGRVCGKSHNHFNSIRPPPRTTFVEERL